MITLTHPFRLRCIDRHELLDGVYKFNTFAGRLEKQAQKYARGDEDRKNEYKGWAFELFCEWLIKSHGYDKRIGLIDYQIGEEDEDTGVDGFGRGINGRPATVQIKYRQADHVLTANNDKIDHLVTASQNRYGVQMDDADNMLIITSGKEVHWHTSQNMLYGKVRVINREQIRVLVDDNIPFWDDFMSNWEASLPVPLPVAPKIVKKGKKSKQVA